MALISSLQERIEKRAQERLDKDLLALCSLIRDNRLLSDNASEMPRLLFSDANNPANSKAQIPYWLFEYSSDRGFLRRSDYMDRLREYWLPKYIDEETTEFLNKVGEIEGYLTETYPVTPIPEDDLPFL